MDDTDILNTTPRSVQSRSAAGDTSGSLPRAYRLLDRAMSLVPATANMSQYHRYAF